MSKLQGLVRPEGLGKFKNSPHQVSNPRLPVCSWRKTIVLVSQKKDDIQIEIKYDLLLHSPLFYLSGRDNI
jgi:hypothetical protein